MLASNGRKSRTRSSRGSASPSPERSVEVPLSVDSKVVVVNKENSGVRGRNETSPPRGFAQYRKVFEARGVMRSSKAPRRPAVVGGQFASIDKNVVDSAGGKRKGDKEEKPVASMAFIPPEEDEGKQPAQADNVKRTSLFFSPPSKKARQRLGGRLSPRHGRRSGRNTPEGRRSPLQFSPRRASSPDVDVAPAASKHRQLWFSRGESRVPNPSQSESVEDEDAMKVAAVPSTDGEIVSVSSSDESDADATELKQALHQAALDLDEVKSWCDDSVHSYVGSVGSLEASMLSLVSDQNKLEDEKEKLRVELSATKAELNDAKVYFNIEEAKYKEQLELAKYESKRQMLKHSATMKKTEEAMTRYSERVDVLQGQVSALEKRLRQVEAEKAREVEALRITVAELEKSNAYTLKQYECSESESKELGKQVSILRDSLEKEQQLKAEEIGALSSELSKQTLRAEDAEKNSFQLNVDMKEFGKQYEDMAKAFKKTSDELTETKTKLLSAQDDADKASTFVDDLSRANKVLSAENVTLNSQIASLKEENHAQHEVVEVVRSECAQKDEQIDSVRKELTSEIAAQTQRAEDRQKEVAALEESLRQVRIENSDVADRLHETSKELLQTKTDLHSAEEEAICRTAVVDDLKCRNAALKSQNDALNAKVGSLEDTVQDQHLRLAEVTSMHEEKSAQFEDLRKKHTIELAAQVRRAEESEGELQRLDSTHRRTFDEFEEVAQTLKATSEELSSSKAQLSRVHDESLRRAAAIADLTRRNEVLTVENEKLCHEISNRQEDLISQQQDLDRISGQKDREIEELRLSLSEQVRLQSRRTQAAESHAEDLERQLEAMNQKFTDLSLNLQSTNEELVVTKSLLHEKEVEVANTVAKQNFDLSQANETLTNQIAALMDEIRSQQDRTLEAQTSASKMREEKERELDRLRRDFSQKAVPRSVQDAVDARLVSLTQQYDDAVASLETTSQELSQTRSQLQSSLDETSRISTNVEEMRRQNGELFSENETLLSKISTLQVQVRSEHQKFTEAEAAAEEARQEKQKELNDLRSEMTDRLRSETQRAEAAQTRLEEINGHIKQVTESLKETQAQLSYRKSQLQAAQAESLRRSELVEEIKRQNEDIHKENGLLKHKVSALQLEMTEQRERIVEVEREAIEARDEKEREIVALRCKASDEASKENERCIQLEAELMQMNVQYEAIATSLKSTEVELNETKLQLKTAQSEAFRNAGSISEVTEKNTRLSNENQILNDQVSALMSDIDAQQEEISAAKAALTRAREEKLTEMDSLRSQLLDKVEIETRKAKEAEETAVELDGQLRSINQQYKDISESYMEVSHELASTKMQLQTTQNAVVRGSLSLDDMMRKHEELAAENQNLSNKIAALQVEINVQNDMMTNAQISLARAREEKNAELAALKEELGEQLSQQTLKTEEAVQHACDVDAELRQMSEQYEEIAMILSSTTEVLVETQAKLERAQADAREFSGRVDELARKNDDLVVENMSLNDEVSALQIEIQAQNDVMTDAQLAAEQAKVNCELALRESREKDARVKELTASYEKAGTEIQKMNETKKNSLEREIQMEILKRSLQSNLSTSEEKCEELEQTNGDLQNVVQTLNQEKERLRRSLIEMAETMKGKENLLTTVSTKNAELLEELNVHREEAERKFIEFNQAIENLEQQLGAAKVERDEVTARLKLTDARENELHRKIRVIDSVRARLHNRIMQLTGNIRVYVRVRPLLQEERAVYSSPVASPSRIKRRHESRLSPPRVRSSGAASTSSAKVKSGSLFTFHELSDKDVASFSSDDAHKKALELEEPWKDRGGLSQRRRCWRFNFDNVFAPESGQEDVWKATEPLVQSAIDGYNVCLFAYGQTGSGKTYTMIGSKQAPGVLHRSADKLFEAKSEIESGNKGKHKVDIMVELLEIYNEQVRDLLAGGPNGRQINLRLTSNEAVGNVVVPVGGHRDIQRVISLAQRRRCVKATMSNSESSRSHLLFTLHFRVRDAECASPDDVGGKVIRHSRLHICDLAGSERIGKSGANTNIMYPGSSLLTETRHINTSLSTLSNVIEKLQANNAHIPFRESKLTYLLRNSLGGDCKTLAIVCCNPVPSHFHESLCSLRFADKVNKVELKAAGKVRC